MILIMYNRDLLAIMVIIPLQTIILQYNVQLYRPAVRRLARLSQSQSESKRFFDVCYNFISRYCFIGF